MASRRGIVLAVLLCASVAFLLFSLHRARVPVARRAGAGRRDATLRSSLRYEARAGTAPGEQPAAAAIAAAAPADVDFSRYQGLAKRSIFAPRGAKAPGKEGRGARSGPVSASQLPPLGPRPEPPRTPDLNGWAYLGYVVLDGNKVGIVQQASSGRCEYLAVGASFLGARVQDVNDRTIRFRCDSSEPTLTRTRDFHLLPLDRGTPAAPPAAPVRPRPQE